MFFLFDFQMGLQKGPKSDFSHFFFRNQNYQFSHFRRIFFVIDIIGTFRFNVFSFSSGDLLI